MNTPVITSGNYKQLKASKSEFCRFLLRCNPLKPGFRLTDGGADERRRVSDVVETLSLDEVGHGRREVLVVSLHVVLENQTAQRTCGLVCRDTEVCL